MGNNTSQSPVAGTKMTRQTFTSLVSHLSTVSAWKFGSTVAMTVVAMSNSATVTGAIQQVTVSIILIILK